jgi:hypothetical protein
VVLSLEATGDEQGKPVSDIGSTKALLAILLGWVDLVERTGALLALESIAPFFVDLESIRRGASPVAKKRVARPVVHQEMRIAFSPLPGVAHEEAVAKGLEASERAAEYLFSGHPFELLSRIDKLRGSLQELAGGLSVFLTMGKKRVALTDLATIDPVPPIYEFQSLRAEVIKVGGKPCKIQVRAFGFERPFSLTATRELALEAGKLLYTRVDIEAKLMLRDAAHVVTGDLISIRNIAALATPKLIDRWYKQVGQPWRQVDNIALKLRHVRG